MRLHSIRFGGVLMVTVLAVACGGDPAPVDGGADSAAPVDAATVVCGNALVEGTETCDDGNTNADDGCSPECALECGDGRVSGAELCDTSIAAGTAGACPTACDDMDPCTTDALDGTGCGTECSFAPITAPANGDGCCPVGSDMTTDDDCTSVCGNGTVEGMETCDSGIAAGLVGACPTACDDSVDCTSDTLVNPGTCSAACDFAPITEAVDGDFCCPPTETPASDTDCDTSGCGDGTVGAGERCDTAIAAGMAGACPTVCDDMDPCTMDSLVNSGSCRATCATTLVGPGAMDMCCPAGANLANDPDCPPACGDTVITPPEACDDGNTMDGDGCSATCQLQPVAFRFTDLDLMDPHVFADAPLLGCADVTNLDVLGVQGINPLLQTNITSDGDTNGLLDLSLAHVFFPHRQAAGTMSPSYLVFPECSDPFSSTSCTLPAGSPRTMGDATNTGGGATCLDVLAGTTRPYAPAIAVPTAPAGGSCYAVAAGTVTFGLSGIPITLQDAQIAGEWFGTPATEIRDGMVRGFLTEADANATLIPMGLTGIATIDGQPLSTLLRGGTGNCRDAAPAMGDKDTLGGVPGWYFYLNFSAARVPYVEL